MHIRFQSTPIKIKRLKKLSNGFTIVELLIVIVVIGILSTTTVLAYTGLQKRALNSAIIHSVSQWVKILKTYEATVGKMQISGADATLGTYICLGDPSDFPADSDFGAGKCRGAGYYEYTAQWFSDKIRAAGFSASGKLPTLNSYGGMSFRGITYTSYGSSGMLEYYLKGTTDCGIAGATAAPFDTGPFPDVTGLTQCRLPVSFSFSISP